MGTYTEGRDNDGTETSNGTVGEVGQEGDGNEEPGLWVFERLLDLGGLDGLVLNTGLLVTHALHSNDSLLWVQEVGGHWAVWQEEPHSDTPNAGSSTDDHELVLPWRQIALDLADGVKEKGSYERTHSDGGVPDSVTHRLLARPVPHGGDEGESWCNTGLGESKEETLNHQSWVVLDGDSADGDTSPQEDDSCNVLAQRETLRQVNTWNETEEITPVEDEGGVRVFLIVGDGLSVDEVDRCKLEVTEDIEKSCTSKTGLVHILECESDEQHWNQEEIHSTEDSSLCFRRDTVCAVGIDESGSEINIAVVEVGVGLALKVAIVIIVLDRDGAVGVLLIARGCVGSGRLLVGNGLSFDTSGHSD